MEGECPGGSLLSCLHHQWMRPSSSFFQVWYISTLHMPTSPCYLPHYGYYCCECFLRCGFSGLHDANCKNVWVFPASFMMPVAECLVFSFIMPIAECAVFFSFIMPIAGCAVFFSFMMSMAECAVFSSMRPICWMCSFLLLLDANCWMCGFLLHDVICGFLLSWCNCRMCGFLIHCAIPRMCGLHLHDAIAELSCAFFCFHGANCRKCWFSPSWCNFQFVDWICSTFAGFFCVSSIARQVKIV